ncbi:MAG: hypothetical protein LBC12_08020, partial [Nitrososphaerota archaeon]|jgi:hypothetical protein|nr:hypothetical protein [Nitrososphaerota archaeon]
VDGSFIGSVLSNLLSYYDSVSGGFRHLQSGGVDMMATEQAAYTLVAYDRYVKGQSTLYDMRDTDPIVDGNKNANLNVDDNKGADSVSDLMVVVEDLYGGSGIFVTAKPNVLPSGVELEVILRISGEKYDKTSSALNDKGITFLLFDISLLKNNEELHSFGGEKITVSIPVPKDYNGTKCMVYHIDDSGNAAVDMKAKLVNGCLVFDTDHLSLYAVTQTFDLNPDKKDNTNNGDLNPNTGDNVNSGDNNGKLGDSGGNVNMWLWVGGISVLIVVLGVLLLLFKHRKSKAR